MLAIPKELREKAATALNKAALLNESLAKQLAPRDTGFLANSIEADASATESNLQSETTVGAEYGVYVELGTVHQSPQPFMTPAFEQAAKELKEDLADALK